MRVDVDLVERAARGWLPQRARRPCSQPKASAASPKPLRPPHLNVFEPDTDLGAGNNRLQDTKVAPSRHGPSVVHARAHPNGPSMSSGMMSACRPRVVSGFAAPVMGCRHSAKGFQFRAEHALLDLVAAEPEGLLQLLPGQVEATQAGEQFAAHRGQ